jgi:hypothetical protein
MPIGQTRRRFLTTLSLADAGVLVCAPQVRAAEALLETTTVRLGAMPASVLLRYTPLRSCCAVKA